MAIYVWELWASWDDECTIYSILMRKYLLHLWELRSFWEGDTRELTILPWLILSWISVKSLKGIMWNYWVVLCGVFVVGYELPLLWNNLLTPKKEIKSETDPLWCIEIKWQNVDVCKGFDEEVMFEANLSIYVKPQQYTPIFVFSEVEIYTMKKIFPFSFWWQ